MVKSQFDAIIKNFNSRFKTNYTLKEVEGTLKILKLESKGLLEQALISLSFLYFKEQGFSLTKSYPINEYKDAKKCISNLFKKPKPISYENREVIICIKNRFRNSYNTIGRGVTACTRNDIAIYDIHKKRFFCDSQSVLDLFKKIVKKSKISKGDILIHKVSKNFLKRMLEFKRLKIYEIEFHNIPEQDIPDFYFKAGSKKKPINKKIKEIIKKIVKEGDIFAFNIKSMLVSEKNFPKKKERIRISVKPEGPRKYQIIIQTKKPSLKLREKLIGIFKELGVKFDEEIVFDDEPFVDSVFQLIRKKQILDYSEYKKEIENWDINKFLIFKNKKLYVIDKKILEYLKLITKEKFDFNETEQNVEGIKIKGFTLIRKKDKKRIFSFFNKGSAVDTKRITKLIGDKRIPFFSINLKKNYPSCHQEIPFSYFNENTLQDFNGFINEIIDNPYLYTNLIKNFENSSKELKTIRNRLAKLKKVNVKGDKWERICSNILNFTFRDSFPLGRSYLPDGLTYFSSDETILWDSKALLSKKSYFKQSVKGKKKGSIKDTFYAKAFNKYNYNFQYYVYFAIGVKKEEFEEVKKRIRRYLKKRNIKVKIVLITDKWLKSFVDEFKIEDVSRLHTHLDEITNILKKEFEKGYLDNFEISFKKVGQSSLQNIKEIKQDIKDNLNG